MSRRELARAKARVDGVANVAAPGLDLGEVPVPVRARRFGIDRPARRCRGRAPRSRGGAGICRDRRRAAPRAPSTRRAAPRRCRWARRSALRWVGAPSTEVASLLAHFDLARLAQHLVDLVDVLFLGLDQRARVLLERDVIVPRRGRADRCRGGARRARPAASRAGFGRCRARASRAAARSPSDGWPPSR